MAKTIKEASDAELRRELRKRKREAKAHVPEYAYVQYTVTLVHRIERNRDKDVVMSDADVIAEARDYFDKDNVNSLNRYYPESSLMNYEIGAGQFVELEDDWLPKRR